MLEAGAGGDSAEFLGAYGGVEVYTPETWLARELDRARDRGQGWSGAITVDALSGRAQTIDGDALLMRAIWRDEAGERTEVTLLSSLAERALRDPRGFIPPHQIVPDYDAIGITRPAFFEAGVCWTRDVVSTRLTLPRPLRHEVRLFLWDYRGLSAALFDERASRLRPDVSFGVDLASMLLGTAISPLRRRREQALGRITGAQPQGARQAARLGRPYIAGSVAEYLDSAAALADGRTPPLGYTDRRYVDGRELADAPQPGWVEQAACASCDRRRSALAHAAHGALAADAFGSGIDSPRSRRSKTNLDDDHPALRYDAQMLARLPQRRRRVAASDRAGARLATRRRGGDLAPRAPCCPPSRRLTDHPLSTLVEPRPRLPFVREGRRRSASRGAFGRPERRAVVARRRGRGDPWSIRIDGYGEEEPVGLIPNPRNWRKHPRRQRRALAEAIDAIGFISPVTVNRRNGRLIDGHLRVELAIARGEQRISVIYVDLDEDAEALALATLDPLGALAETDADLLDELLHKLELGEGELGELVRDVVPTRGSPASARRSGSLTLTPPLIPPAWTTSTCNPASVTPSASTV